jgi:hypothetical protein
MARGGRGARFLYASPPVTSLRRLRCRHSTATSTGARLVVCRRWTDGPRRALGRYGAARCARPQEDSEEPRGATHVEGARLGRWVAFGDAWCVRRGRPACGHGANRAGAHDVAARRCPGLNMLLAHCLNAFFPKICSQVHQVMNTKV